MVDDTVYVPIFTNEFKNYILVICCCLPVSTDLTHDCLSIDRPDDVGSLLVGTCLSRI